MSAENRTVKISGISPQTEKEGLSSFIGFCGVIESIELGANQEATVVFAKESAAKTASLLNGGTLDGAVLTIESPNTTSDHKEEHHPESETGHISQESKPRTAIVAELLAHGYHLSDLAAHKAIELDGQYGISKNFLDFFRPLQQQATTNVKAIDDQHKISAKATELGKQADAKLQATENSRKVYNIGKNYYEKALQSDVGSKVASFYTLTVNTVQDVHEEARRIADSRKPQSPVLGTSAAATSAPTVATNIAPATAA